MQWNQFSTTRSVYAYIYYHLNHSFSLWSWVKLRSWEKPLKCHHCDKTFVQNDNLRVHERLHTGEEPFNCHHCGKTFVQNDDLRVHERLHTDEKPFKCHHCDKTLVQNDDLRVHERLLWKDEWNICQLVVDLSSSHHQQLLFTSGELFQLVSAENGPFLRQCQGSIMSW